MTGDMIAAGTCQREHQAGPDRADLTDVLDMKSAGLLGQPGAWASRPRQADPSPRRPQHRTTFRRIKSRAGPEWADCSASGHEDAGSLWGPGVSLIPRSAVSDLE